MTLNEEPVVFLPCTLLRKGKDLAVNHFHSPGVVSEGDQVCPESLVPVLQMNAYQGPDPRRQRHQSQLGLRHNGECAFRTGDEPGKVQRLAAAGSKRLAE